MAFSFFFRDLPALELASDLMIEATQGQSKIRVWDAGCAMGQEPYSLAMVLAEKMNHFAFQNLKIHATDIESEFEPIVTKALYPEKDLARLDISIVKKYFSPPDGEGFMKVVENIRSKIKFSHHDILKLKPISSGLNMIVCKNVLLHFQPQQRIEVFKMFHSALAKNGVLANENTQKLPEQLNHMFEQIEPNCQVYRKKEVTSLL